MKFAKAICLLSVLFPSILLAGPALVTGVEYKSVSKSTCSSYASRVLSRLAPELNISSTSQENVLGESLYTTVIIYCDSNAIIVSAAGENRAQLNELVQSIRSSIRQL